MRKGSSITTLLLAAGAGWLASNLWRSNAGGVRENVLKGSQRVREQGGRWWQQNAERLGWGARGREHPGEGPRENYAYDDWRYSGTGEPGEGRPTDQQR